MRTALTIAGSDSGGGAGIQADLKTFAAHGVFGTSAITAVTAQNTRGVSAVHILPPAMVRAQIDAVVSDIRPDAVKIGMLASAAIVTAVAQALDAHALQPVVLDPVMVAKGGSRLLSPEAVDAMSMLLSRAAIVTPNLAEAEVMTGAEVRDLEGMERAARVLVDSGAGAALVKGGHLQGGTVIDVLWTGRDRHVFDAPRIDTTHTHGTGCTLSSAIAAQLALGLPLVEAVEAAIAYVRRAIASAPGLGQGHGPLNHFPYTD
ncbi:MAG TPA: bifunctional hydroxymethylpyrimidine kinase/phosphomethylpyrimidine kinase [Vicinamibacterales bacterium]|nr:bifunctional hydroxymethylpyrimidine kinase/phosphomethylpyrimidine kinase [Vicinamibacterales bacterium]